MLKKILTIFNKHPHSIGETYWQHVLLAMKIVLKLFWTASNLFCHAIFPFLRVNYARDQIFNISNTLLQRNSLDYSASCFIVNDISEMIHQTPLVYLRHFSSSPDVKIYAKCEMFNPSLSVKDRIVLNMIKAHEKSGKLKSGGVIIEASSGNTGCSLAMLAACFGYRAIITVPVKISREKVTIMRAFGATVVVSPSNITLSSPEHYINKARLIQKQTPDSVLLDQYENPINLNTHYKQTASEIWDALSGKVDCVIACSSSGGTISGLGRYFKEKKPSTKIIMPDPMGSIYYHYFKTKKEIRSQYRAYKIEGIGKDYICGNIDFSVIDDVIKVSDQDAFSKAKYLAQREGIFAGGSSGAALHVANIYADRFCREHKKANIVVILPDSGVKYLSTFYSNS